MTAISNGGAAQRVKVLQASDLKANGGAYSLEGRPPVAVYGVVDAETTAQGGDYVVMGNVAQPVYVVDPPDGVGEATIAPIPMIAVDGGLAMGNVAIPVYVVGGSLGGLDPVTNLVLEVTGTNRETITATWDTVTGATDYEIEYSPDGVTYVPVGTTALLTFDIEDTDYDPNAVTHYVRVRAVGGDDWTTESISGLLVNLVAFWELDEASGNRVDRVSGLILTDSGTVGSATGHITALAADLDGANALSLADNATISMGAGVRCTFMGWVYPDSVDGNFFTKRSSAVLEYINRFQGGNFQFIVSPDGTGGGLGFVATPQPSASAWAMYCARYTGTVVTANINNGAEATAAYSADIFNGTTALQIGNIVDVGEGYDGRINGTGIWKRALSAGQQADFHNGGTGKNYPFL